MNDKPIILIIEDDRALRDVLVRSLKNDFTVLEAQDGVSGVQYAQQYLPDVIICDIAMPELDGFGVLATLRHNEETAVIPFIFLTARQEYVDIRLGMSQGADDYLTKPFSLHELREAVNTRLQKKREIDRRNQRKLDELRENITRALPHEFRTPLAMIYGYVHLLLEDFQNGSPEHQAMLKTIEDYTHRLHELTEKFLTYTRTEILLSNPENVEEGQIDNPHEIISYIAAEKAARSQREADIILAVNPAVIGISADHFARVVDEIIDNALKFSPPGSQVFVLGVAQENVYALSVINHGRGMTQEQIETIGAYMQFERDFYEQPGLGLGLITAKRLAEAHRGQVSIHSIPNEETTVTVLLPCSSQTSQPHYSQRNNHTPR
jgi:signal transduction histidine kinase